MVHLLPGRRYIWILGFLFFLAACMTAFLPGPLQAATGRNWRLVDAPSQWMWGIWGSSGINVVAVGSTGTVRRFDGSAWKEIGPGSGSLYAVWGSNPFNVLVSNLDGNAWLWKEASWSAMTSGDSSNFIDLSGLGSWDIFGVRANLYEIGYWDGSVWTGVPLPQIQEPGDGWGSVFAAEENAILISLNKTIYRTDRTRLRNEDLTPPQRYDTLFSGSAVIRDIWAASPTAVFAVGDGGLILRYNGTAWETQTSGTTQNLRSVHGSGLDRVYAAGDNGTLLFYDGASWKAQQLPGFTGTIHLRGVWAEPASAWSTDAVYAVGNLMAPEGGSVLQNGVILFGEPILPGPAITWGKLDAPRHRLTLGFDKLVDIGGSDFGRIRVCTPATSAECFSLVPQNLMNRSNNWDLEFLLTPEARKIVSGAQDRFSHLLVTLPEGAVKDREGRPGVEGILSLSDWIKDRAAPRILSVTYDEIGGRLWIRFDEWIQRSTLAISADGTTLFSLCSEGGGCIPLGSPLVIDGVGDDTLPFDLSPQVKTQVSQWIKSGYALKVECAQGVLDYARNPMQPAVSDVLKGSGGQSSVTLSPAKPLKAGGVLTIDVRSAPGASVYYSILNTAALARPLSESAAGVYTGAYTVSQGDNAIEKSVAIQIIHADGRRESFSSLQTVYLDALALLKDSSVSPGTVQNGQKIDLSAYGEYGAYVFADMSQVDSAGGVVPLNPAGSGPFGSEIRFSGSYRVSTGNSFANGTKPIMVYTRDPAGNFREAAASVQLQNQGSPGTRARTKGNAPATLDAGDPVNMATGEYHFGFPMFDLGGPLPLTFGLSYSSQLDAKAGSGHEDGLPPNFITTAHIQLRRYPLQSPQAIAVDMGLGRQVNFRQMGGGWQVFSIEPVPFQLQEDGTSYGLYDPAADLLYFFEKIDGDGNGRLLFIRDRNGNTHRYTFNQDLRVARIEDDLGRSLRFTYETLQGKDYLVRVADQNDRGFQFAYEYNPSDNPSQVALRSITDLMGNVTSFTYLSSHDNLLAVRHAKGNTPFRQTYDPGFSNRKIVKTQTDAYDHVTTIAAEVINENAPDYTRFTEILPDGAVRTYEHYREARTPRSMADWAGNRIEFETDAMAERVTEVRDRMGGSTLFSYHEPSGKLAGVTNARGDRAGLAYTARTRRIAHPGEEVRFTFDGYDLARIDYPDGGSEKFTRDATGNVTRYTDPAMQEWEMTYNARGQVLTVKNPLGGVTTYTYNGDGTPATVSDPEGETTSFAYDAFRRVIQITNPDETQVKLAYDLLDRVTSVTDENNRQSTYAYDANGNLIRATDPAGAEFRYGYDLMDRLVEFTDRLGKKTALTYDEAGRLAGMTDPSGLATTFGYDPRGWPDRTMRSGRTWKTGYDAEGVVSSITSPSGRSSMLLTDGLGNVTAARDPLGQTTRFARDAMTRVTSVTDPLNRITGFAYDRRGGLTGVALPEGTRAAYRYNGLGLLSRITDLNRSEWTFGHTAMGRLSTATDPLGDTTSHTYSNRGLPVLTRYPDGATATRSFDASGRLTRELFSDGLDIPYTYDAAGRLTGTAGIGMTLDAEGRVTETSQGGVLFGATRDDAGRLATVAYPAPEAPGGLLTVTFAYAAATGALTRVSDNLSGAWVSFDYDNDLRPIGITRSNGVGATLTWNDAGRLVRVKEGAFLDLACTLDAAGRVTQTRLTAPLTPETRIQPSAATFTFDAASRISNTGYTYDRRGRLTASPAASGAPARAYVWDGASRLTGVEGATLAYNGFGDLSLRTAGGSSTRFFQNRAIALNPIVAERDETTGRFLRYYVWTPGGSLLYMIDAGGGNAVRFFHFDLAGSTLALTDAGGTVTDGYAYDPQGRLLAHEGNSPQPFTFLGKWGVRQEGTSGTLYQMRARYYDAVSARFLSREPVWPALADPVQLNPYQYARNQPLHVVDITGLGPVMGNFWQYQQDAENWEEILSNNAPPEFGEERARQFLWWQDVNAIFRSSPAPAIGGDTPSFLGRREAARKAPPLYEINLPSRLFSPSQLEQFGLDPGGLPPTANTPASSSTPAGPKTDPTQRAITVVKGVANAAHNMGQVVTGTHWAVPAKWSQTIFPLKAGALPTAKVIARGCTLTAGVVSWVDVGYYATKTPADISREVGENRNSWNPLVRGPAELGNLIGDFLFKPRYFRR